LNPFVKKPKLVENLDLSSKHHPGVEHHEAIEADYQMKDGMLVLGVRAQLVCYGLRRWSVDCTHDHRLNTITHYLSLLNPQTLYGVESATLATVHIN
jgi:hypothetical protein